MIIAAHLSGEVLSDLLFAMANKHPEHSFIFFTNKTFSGLPANCGILPVSPKPKNKLLLYYWYRYKLPALLIKKGATVFISDAGMLSLSPALPQYLYFADRGFQKKTTKYFNKIFENSIEKATGIFTAEDHIEYALRPGYPSAAGKIKTIYHGLTFKDTYTDAEKIKERFTGGFDYFICPVHSASSSNLISLLKAFSQFKKRQKSSLQLVFLLCGIPKEKFLPELKTYKYEAEVKLIAEQKDHASLISSAFTMILPETETLTDFALFAMQQKVPVIAELNEVNRNIMHDAAVYNDLTAADLSEKMQMIYKDEAAQVFHKERGAGHVLKYDTERSSSLLFDELSK